MKKICVAVVAAFIVLALAGCGSMVYPDLPSDAPAFETGTLVDVDDDNAEYATIEYKGRTYIPYGTQGATMTSSDVDACIGYVVYEGQEPDTDFRLFTIAGDPQCNYLMEYYVANNLMNPPMFYRATDTRGFDIDTPDIIDSLEYAYWESE